MSYAPIGSLCCIESSGDAVIFDHSGTVLATFTIPGISGHSGSITGGGACQLPTGEIMVCISPSSGTGFQAFLDSQFNAVANTTTATGSGQRNGAACSSSHFFIINATGFTKFNPSGSVNTTYSKSSTLDRGIAVDAAGAIAYHYPNSGPDRHKYKKTTLGGATTTFVDRSATFDDSVSDPGIPTVLQDGIVILPWFDGNDSHSKLSAYDPSGALLWDVDLGTGNSDFVITMARGAGASYFWVVFDDDIFYPTASSVFKKIDASNGSVISSFSKSNLENSVQTDNMGMFELTVAYGTPPGPTPPVTPTTTLVNSAPACIKSSAPSGTAAGEIFPVGPNWTPSCAGSGVVPSAADVSLAESWDF